IAFNDPGVADFNDPVRIKTAKLDDVCRMQQVHDGCFPTFDDVPTHAYTLTIPQMVSADYMFCVVPAATKADAVYNTVTLDITDQCPATILRNHDHAILYCDADSGKKVL
ncbi:MAG: glucosamine-6-phosphate deaminase, partial [Clostridia bacterium]|nr:glucosamine-6-phosphate deaminase [Clostridia bacterium]